MGTHLATASESDYVLMTDAMDVWFQLSPSFLVKRFEELDAELVIGADRMCAPNNPESVSQPRPLPSLLTMPDRWSRLTGKISADTPSARVQRRTPESSSYMALFQP